MHPQISLFLVKITLFLLQISLLLQITLLLKITFFLSKITLLIANYVSSHVQIVIQPVSISYLRKVECPPRGGIQHYADHVSREEAAAVRHQAKDTLRQPCEKRKQEPAYRRPL